jgi:hypothetical protein
MHDWVALVGGLTDRWLATVPEGGVGSGALHTSRGMEPTPLALQLAEPVAYALGTLHTCSSSATSACSAAGIPWLGSR